MRDHYWEISHGEHILFIEVCLYSTRHSMIRGIYRNWNRMQFKGDCPDKSNCDALCRSHCETIDGKRVPICRLFFNEKSFRPGVIAHEAMHASHFANTVFFGKLSISSDEVDTDRPDDGDSRNLEEDCAQLCEMIVDSILEWERLGFPDEEIK